MNDSMSGPMNHASSADVGPLSGQRIYGYLPPMTEVRSQFEDFARTILAVPRAEADAEEAKRAKRRRKTASTTLSR